MSHHHHDHEGHGCSIDPADIDPANPPEPPYRPENPADDDVDRKLWQFRPLRIEVDADAFCGVEPFQAEGIEVREENGRFVIEGSYGFDLFTDHHFTILVDGVLREYTRLEDIPESFDNVISCLPDATHDITFVYRFEKDGKPFEHSHWIHHDMEPWNEILQQLLTRETNGGWNASSHTPGRRRHAPLHAHEPHGLLTDRVRK